MFYSNCPRNGTIWFYNTVMHPKDADGMVNSVDSDQEIRQRNRGKLADIDPLSFLCHGHDSRTSVALTLMDTLPWLV